MHSLLSNIIIYLIAYFILYEVMKLKKTSQLKKVLSDIVGGILILFVPELLSPLHIASYKHWIDCEESKKELKKLSKKLIKINYRLTGMKVQTDSKELFYAICKQMESLSLKELNVLRAFCNAIAKQNRLDLRMHRDIDEIVKLTSEYKDTIDEYIDSKKVKVNFKKFY